MNKPHQAMLFLFVAGCSDFGTGARSFGDHPSGPVLLNNTGCLSPCCSSARSGLTAAQKRTCLDGSDDAGGR